MCKLTTGAKYLLCVKNFERQIALKVQTKNAITITPGVAAIGPEINPVSHHRL